jgi:hypothetical protein
VAGSYEQGGDEMDNYKLPRTYSTPCSLSLSLCYPMQECISVFNNATKPDGKLTSVLPSLNLMCYT